MGGFRECLQQPKCRRFIVRSQLQLGHLLYGALGRSSRVVGINFVLLVPLEVGTAILSIRYRMSRVYNSFCGKACPLWR